MRVSREETPPLQAVLTIEVEPQEMEHHLEQAYRRLVQRVSVPGFRRGKAPRRILEQRLGRDALLHDAVEQALPEVTAQAVREFAPEAVGQPEIEVVGMEPLSIKATVALPPVVELGDYRSIHIPRDPVVVDGAEVERALEELRGDSAPWEPVERPLQMGDLGVIDLRGTALGKQVFSIQEGQYIVSQEPRPAEGFGEALVGLAPGETREFDLELPEDYPDPDVAGASCHFTVSLKESKERRPPPLDDEFARGVGQGYESLEALRLDIERRLRAAMEREARQAYEGLVVEQLLETGVVDLPPLLVEREIDHVLADLRGGVQSQMGRPVTMDEYLSAVGRSPEELKEEMRPQALARLKRALLLDRLADDEGIEVTKEDVEEEIERMAQGAGAQAQQVRALLRRPDNLASLERSLRPVKTIRRLAALASGQAEEAQLSHAEAGRSEGAGPPEG